MGLVGGCLSRIVPQGDLQVATINSMEVVTGHLVLSSGVLLRLLHRTGISSLHIIQVRNNISNHLPKRMANFLSSQPVGTPLAGSSGHQLLPHSLSNRAPTISMDSRASR